jgi:hypothetical protein
MLSLLPIAAGYHAAHYLTALPSAAPGLGRRSRICR